MVSFESFSRRGHIVLHIHWLLTFRLTPAISVLLPVLVLLFMLIFLLLFIFLAFNGDIHWLLPIFLSFDVKNGIRLVDSVFEVVVIDWDLVDTKLLLELFLGLAYV